MHAWWNFFMRLYLFLLQREQLESHSNKAHEIEKDLHEHRQFPPEKGSKARIIQDYIEKESYLEHEARFTTLLWNIFAESLLLYFSKKKRTVVLETMIYLKGIHLMDFKFIRPSSKEVVLLFITVEAIQHIHLPVKSSHGCLSWTGTFARGDRYWWSRRVRWPR